MTQAQERVALTGQPPPWVTALVALVLATAVGSVAAQALLAPPRNELRDLALYFAVAGVATMAAGWLALRLVERSLRLSIRARVFVSSATGSAVALVNVFIVARLMFVNTSHDLRLLAALIVFSGLVTTAFSLWVASTLTSRVREVTRAIGELAEGRYQQRLPQPGDDEVAALARDVEVLAARLEGAARERERLEHDRRELTAAISHDLRTPLSSVRAMVEALGDGVVEDPAEVARYFEAMRRQIERLDRMIDDLFELARMDAGALELERHPLALQEVAAEVIDAMQAQATQADVTLELHVDGAAPELALDGARMERAIANLVRNALEHTPAGGRVEVRVGVEASAALLEVSDSGEGVPATDLARVWDRFYRGEKSRQRAAGAKDGAGLGLAIVRAIVEAHGGAVAVTSEVGAGATFALRVPLEAAVRT